MHTHTKLMVAAATIAVFMAIIVTTAHASRFEPSEQGFVIRFAELASNLEGPFIHVTCPVTLQGSFHSRTISKVCGQLIGHIAKASVAQTEPPCSGGSETVLTENLPWHIQYTSFAGTLPLISRLRIAIVGARFLIRDEGFSCLWQSGQRTPLMADIAISANRIHRVEGLTVLPEFPISTAEAPCIVEGNMRATGSATIEAPPGPPPAVTVRLVA
jgi:hypothetical protein